MKWITLPVLALIPLLLSCVASSSPGEASAAVVAQWSGQQGGNPTAGDRILRTAEQWQSAWRQVGRDPPRALDRAREMGVAIFRGERTTGGHSVEVVDARVLGESYAITFRATAPAPGDFTTQALTRPWAIAIVRRSDLPIVVQNLAPPPDGEQRPENPTRPSARQER